MSTGQEKPGSQGKKFRSGKNEKVSEKNFGSGKIINYILRRHIGLNIVLYVKEC